MVPEDDEILFTNFNYNPDYYYFLYVGELKTYSLNYFVQEALAHRIPNRPIKFVAIVPDICIQYNYANIIVINPRGEEEFISDHAFVQQEKKPRRSWRIDSSRFMSAVSNNSAIRTLIDRILERQNQLYINLYESVLDMTLDQIERVSILGPDKYIARQFNNKITQYKALEGVVPLADHKVCEDKDCLLKTTADLRSQWTDGIFVSGAYSAAGINSAVTYNQHQVESRFGATNDVYLISKFIPHQLDPTVLAVVANDQDVYIAGIADQVIVDGNRFIGSKFPSLATPEQKQKMHEYTVRAGRMLGEKGYRGIFGCDYLIDNNGEILFLEINARKQGTTLEFCYTLEQTLPEGAPMLPELEYYAVTEGRFPRNTVEMKENLRKIHWGTYNYKIQTKKLTTGYIPQNPYERETFRKVANGELLKDFVILEHPGTNFLVMPGMFLARVVSVARNREDVDEGLCQGVGFIQQTIVEAE
ncbi:ATP-grasp domain-containing protein [Desulfofustis glycolicus]|uniref:ATP-grasp domain-containing protein n=1 Tax=Desulfofustis glycolicus DSM 9705 TaxID=1121409 RepID=A0A1M5W260_9BACT|nr:ATP-grasp domain-containing protein [Desulfofustis glycolicus]MCB2215098.1 ATP-grasp domain-containing protein [Desulfobulbaceae bacterium]SHH81520.1 ATP-grasp domain-containing protein [Desulfofustis glycolicus DSM 9705]